MKIDIRPIAEIKPYPNNPRINDDAVDAVASSIKEFGFRQPIVVDTDGVIICGHTRFKAAQKLGLEKVPIHVATDLTPEQIKAYRIADNKSSELADWNFDLLPIELGELQTAGFDLSLLGFDSDELLRTAQMQAHSQIVVLPLPRGIAIEKSPPRRTACSIRLMTFR